ncbi:MAG: hypothetical protein JWN70_4320 [Planctomycetaceae bacterium]|nr:hypothetical protein [Planctomycetaceae bacterium]
MATKQDSESHSLTEIVETIRDDGGTTPYNDPTGEAAVWNLLLGRRALPGQYVLSGPAGVQINIDDAVVQLLLSLVDLTPNRRHTRMNATLKQKKSRPASTSRDSQSENPTAK